jgi:predicted NBD/HSP70 family sugar kinase
MTELEKSAYILVRRGIARTRAELARRLEVSRPTASTAAEKLLSAGLIAECGKGKSTGGTAPILLSARKDVPGFIGIDLGYADRMSGVLLDGAGGIAAEAERTFDPADLASIAENTEKLINALSPAKKIPGAAVALSAIIDEKSGRITSSINPVFRDGNIKEFLENELACPVFTANRSRAAAVSEAFGGAADSEENFALVSLGRSVGAAFWCAGKLFCGANSAAGEIRDLRLASGERLEEALSPEKTARADREDVLEVCADALSQLVAVMDFRLLILSGRFADFGKGFSSALERKLARKTRGVRVKSARFGRYSAARGSAFRMGELFIPFP